MDRIKLFYTNDIGVEMVYNQKYDDGSELAVFTFKQPETERI